MPMYLYVYDAGAQESRNQRELGRVEARLQQLDIRGAVSRLNILKSLRGVIHDAVRDGQASTIVVVGDDQSFAQAVNAAACSNLTIGFLPIGGPSRFGRLLGIPPGVLACEVLASRITRKLDLGKVNGSYFFESVEVADDPQAAVINLGPYQIAALSPRAKVLVANFAQRPGKGAGHTNPADALLDLIIDPGERSTGFFHKERLLPSAFPVKRLQITSAQPLSLLVDQGVLLKTPAQVEVVPQALKVIVGSERVFE